MRPALLARALDDMTLVGVEGERSQLIPRHATDELRELLAREDEHIRGCLDRARARGAEDFAGVIWDSQRPAEQAAFAEYFGMVGFIGVLPRDELAALIARLRPKAKIAIGALREKPPVGYYPLAILSTDSAVVILTTPNPGGAS